MDSDFSKRIHLHFHLSIAITKNASFNYQSFEKCAFLSLTLLFYLSDILLLFLIPYRQRKPKTENQFRFALQSKDLCRSIKNPRVKNKLSHLLFTLTLPVPLPSIPISIKSSLECFFSRNNGANQQEYLHTTDDTSNCSYCILCLPHYRYYNYNCYDQRNYSTDIPYFTAAMMSKYPSSSIFYGHCCSIPEYSIYFLWSIFQKISAKTNHSKWNQQIHQQHKNPKSHSNTSLYGMNFKHIVKEYPYTTSIQHKFPLYILIKYK